MAIDLYFPSITLPLQLLASAVVLFSLARKWIFSSKEKSKALVGKTLPGPRGLPWAGPVWAADGAHMWRTFSKWADDFGDIYTVKLFGTQFVIISHPDIAKEVLAKQGSIISHRPPIPCVPGSQTLGEYMPFLGHNDMFRRQRRFGTMVNAAAFRSQYHGYVEPEVQKLLKGLYNKTDYYEVLMELCFANVSTKMTWGITEPAIGVVSNAHALMKNLSPGGRIVNVLYFLQYLPKAIMPEKDVEFKRHEAEYRLWGGLFENARQMYEAGNLPPCYAKTYFDDIKGSGLTDHSEAIYNIAIMATVAILTLDAPAGWFVVAMAKFPKWQKAAQEEIDRVCGDRLPEPSDIPNMPLMRAIMIEVMRWHSAVPTGIPHVIEKDTTYDGYLLPKGCSVLALDWAMTRNKKIYVDADEFNPDRWLNPAYSTYKEPLTEFPKIYGYHGFGFGRRTCIGQEHTTTVLFQTYGAMLATYDFLPEIGHDGKPVEIKVETATPNVIPLPKGQKVRFVPRTEAKKRMVEAIQV